MNPRLPTTTPWRRTPTPRIRPHAARYKTMVLLVTVVTTVLLTSAPALAVDVRSGQWYLPALRVPQAQHITHGQGVTVAVIDRGTDPHVPALQGQVLQGTQFGVPQSPNGTIDTSPVGHGTSMAGIIAGTGTDTSVELGIAPAAKILPIAVPEKNSDQDIAQAIRWAADHNARVVNLSIGAAANTRLPPGVATAVQYAQNKDVVVVAGAGNVEQTGSAVSLFADLPGVVAVSGADKKGNFWTGSSYGPQVVVAAPAVDMVGPTIPSVSSTGYITGSGTSDATAVTSGCVALIRARFPAMDANNVINRLIRTAVPPSDNKRSIYLGFGTVAPYRALTENVPTVTTNPLGGTPATSPGTANTSQPTTGNNGSSGPSLIPWLVGAGICLLVVIAVVILIVVLVTRNRRQPPTPGPYRPGGGFPPGPPHW